MDGDFDIVFEVVLLDWGSFVCGDIFGYFGI